MVEFTSLKSVNSASEEHDVQAQNASPSRMYIIYSELKDSLQDFGFPTLSAFKAHIMSSPEPNQQLAQWQGLAARR